jgi:hypothetical protein
VKSEKLTIKSKKLALSKAEGIIVKNERLLCKVFGSKWVETLESLEGRK